MQRIIDASDSLSGNKFEDLHSNAKKGIPALMNMRTYPRISSYEQALGEVPWHTKSEGLSSTDSSLEFIEHGENLVVHREPVDSTHHEPNVIVAEKHEEFDQQALKLGFSSSDLSSETRQVRNVIKTVDETLKSKHPLKLKLQYSHVYHTPISSRGVFDAD